MKGSITLEGDVFSLQGQRLVSAGADLTGDALGELADKGRREGWEKVGLLEYGSTLRDLKRQMDHGVYRDLFRSSGERQAVLALMETVRLPLPVLDCLGYFKERDFYTYRHTLMVFALSCVLARKIPGESGRGLPEAAAGPLHDLGKICVPLAVLKKSVPLTRSERNVLEQHAAAGYVLLTYYLADPDTFAGCVARDHHERRDGTGYSRGILLADSHIEIVAACDIYDALVMPRPYRKGNYDNRTALEELTSQAEQGKVSWEIVRHLVSMSRGNVSDPEECVVSLEKRGVPPKENCYGIIVQDPEEGGG
jgi:HD-GYP domain-containing protein (c-di-GMP phosphodiesterase class II)